jgi:DNA invertase Pin-like site-specific DNA recombinase
VPEKPPLRIAVYVRVSKGDQKPENQLLELQERVKKEGWTASFFEEKESTKNTRPVKEEVKKRVLKKEFDAVLVWKRDRWARTLSELIGDLNEFLAADSRFISHTEALDYSSAQGRLMVHLLASFAEFERDLNHERTNLGLARARAQGKILGRHPVGCGCGYHSPDGKVHDGPVKPVRDEHNKAVGWRNQTPPEIPPPVSEEATLPENTGVCLIEKKEGLEVVA